MIKNWITFNESKNYGNLYHSICWRTDDKNVAISIYEKIMNEGIKFSTNQDVEYWSKQGNFKFMKGEYFISVTRDKPIKKPTISIPIFDRGYADWITLVLDGESISNKYLIEPINRRGPSEIKFIKDLKNKGTYDEFSKDDLRRRNHLLNSRYCSEERIISKNEGYLSPKYIKEVILTDLNDEQIEIIKRNTPQILK